MDPALREWGPDLLAKRKPGNPDERPLATASAHDVARDRSPKIPAGRYATTEEIGRLARFLVSDNAAYINGESIRIDGGAARSL